MIKFKDAAKYFKNEPHQVDAWDYLQGAVSNTVLDEFARRYRNQSSVIPSPSKPITTKKQSKIPQQAIDLIKKYEGFSPKAYYDPLSGNLPITIGYGSTKRRDGGLFYIGNTITIEEAEDLLSYQLEEKYLPNLVKIPYWNEMNDNQKSALISFAYNLGPYFYNGSNFGTITRHLKNKEWKNIPDALLLYVNPGTSVEKGLRARRIAEGKLWSSPVNKLS